MSQSSAAEQTLLFKDPSGTAESLLQSWVDEFRASMVGPDYFDEYRLVSLSESALDNIRLGTIEQIVFNYSDSVNFSLNVARVTEKETNWYFSAVSPSDSNTRLVLSVFPDGHVSGKLYVLGTGHYMVTPTNVLPYHITYLATGTYIPG